MEKLLLSMVYACEELGDVFMEFLSSRNISRGFLGGAVVKNPPANAGDTGLSPGPGRSHMLQSS